MSKRWRSGDRDFYCRLAYTLIFEGIEGEFHTRREVEPVVWRFPGKERPRANPEVVQSATYGISNIRRRSRRQAIADLFEVSVGNNQ